VIFADRVKDTTVSVGAGAITLGNSAPTGYQTFATAFGVSPVTVAYCIADQAGPNWEVGSGTFDGTTGLTRTTVLASSNAGALVSFTAGTKDVFCTAPASYLAPSGATTQIPYSNGNTYSAASTFTYTSGTNTLSVGNITGSALAMTIQPLAPAVTDTAGLLTISTRNSAKANSPGGSMTIKTGLGLGTGPGGSLSILTGTGGNVSITSGYDVSMTSGNGTSLGGTFSFTAGNATAINGIGGSFLLQGGSATASGGIGGDFTFLPGSGSGIGAGWRNGYIGFQPQEAQHIASKGAMMALAEILLLGSLLSETDLIWCRSRPQQSPP
jgi:hypothetical protein